MRVIKDPGEMRRTAEEARAGGRTVVLVPTMGFLHRGHRELLERGRAAGDVLVLSIFVNPTQFGPGEDFESYPRDMERDLEVAGEEGVDIVYAPEPDAVYPGGFSTFVEVEGLGENLCGPFRPGHFRGVATVVLKLFNTVRPERAVFGRKDYQQLLIIERMARDLDTGVEVIGVDTVRDSDGLATSSRNKYLSEEERRAALAIPRALDVAGAAWAGGERSGPRLTEKMKKIIEDEPEAVIEYIKLVTPDTLEDVDVAEGPVLAALAVRVGRARLIDNRLLG